ncbi:MAG: hypothetical protein REI94_05530 [Moraxellaceae bacterium]|nr:hypothetical protein [Moraxellaceae bacterium]
MTRLIRTWLSGRADVQACNGHLEGCRCASATDLPQQAPQSAIPSPDQNVVRTLPARSFQQLSSFAARNAH